MFESIDDLITRLATERYVLGRDFATNAFLALRLSRPLLLEGEPGLGKSEFGRSLANTLDTRLIRLECHAAVDEREAACEWDVAKQLLRIRLAEANREPFERVERQLHEREFLIARPLMEAFSATDVAPVLLVNNVDLAGRPFETFLAEALSDGAFVVPGHGVIRAKVRPLVVATSSSSRPLSEAFKRICIYHHVDYPAFQEEMNVLLTRVPGMTRALAGSVCNVMARLRAMPGLSRPPGLAEAIAWGQALVVLRRHDLSAEVIDQTIGCLLKTQSDIAAFRRWPTERLLRSALDLAG